MFASDEKLAAQTTDPAWAWAAYQPDAERPWTLRLAGHLFRRAAFGADAVQLAAALADGPQKTIDRLLWPGDVAAFDRAQDAYEATAVGPETGSADAVRDWWLRRMILTPHPLAERMAFFWHDYFAASNLRVNNALLMQKHVALLRRHALGSFGELLLAVCRDAAMIVSAEGEERPSPRPNDRLARHLLARLTVGPGQFSDDDVRAAGRALAGRFVVGRRFHEAPPPDGASPQGFLGLQVAAEGDAVVRAALAHPATPRTVVARLYRWLISETAPPSEALVAPLAESLAKDFDTARLVETMLRSNLFFSPAAYRQRIKGPVDFAVGLVRALGQLIPTAPLGDDLAALGQSLCYPPSGAGWPGGQAWINPFTLLGRSNLAAALLAEGGRYAGKLDPLAVAAKHDRTATAQQFFLDLLLQDDLADEVRQKLLAPLRSAPVNLPQAGRQFVRAVATLPEFQLS